MSHENRHQTTRLRDRMFSKWSANIGEDTELFVFKFCERLKAWVDDGSRILNTWPHHILYVTIYKTNKGTDPTMDHLLLGFPIRI